MPCAVTLVFGVAINMKIVGTGGKKFNSKSKVLAARTNVQYTLNFHIYCYAMKRRSFQPTNWTDCPLSSMPLSSPQPFLGSGGFLF